MNFLAKYGDDMLLIAGFTCIVVGVAQIFIPAAWIMAGLLLTAFAFVFGKAIGKANKQ